MPNFADETGINDETWERVRGVLVTINLERQAISRSLQKIDEATRQLGYVLWPRTDPSTKSRESS